MRRARSRRRPAASVAAPVSKGPHSLATPAYAPLTQAQVDRVVDTAIELLATSGVVFEPGGEADTLLRGAGCTLSDEVILSDLEHGVRSYHDELRKLFPVLE
ncbi:hypothetical protein, partial [Leisingera sp. F5]|uniref:hypothetical protein n=1 Tax=Leisingera sp. F5 TaxID=1813816 RepID=UPI000A8BD7EC